MLTLVPCYPSPQPSPLPPLIAQSTCSSQSDGICPVLQSSFIVLFLQLELKPSMCYHVDQPLGVDWKVTALSAVSNEGEAPMKKNHPILLREMRSVTLWRSSWCWQEPTDNILAESKTGHLNCRWLKLGKMALDHHHFSNQQRVAPFSISMPCWVMCV